MPSNKDWGPFLWTFLHGIAEKLGRQSSDLLASDEAREITLVLRGVEFVMPCEKCRKHYHEYLKKNTIDDVPQKRGDHLRQAVRMWLWRLHEAVNERNNAPSFSLEQLTVTYQTASIADSYSTFNAVVNRAIANGLLNPEQVKSFRRHVSFLRALIGV
jgi:hypothetical protein